MRKLKVVQIFKGYNSKEAYFSFHSQRHMHDKVMGETSL